MAEHAQVTRVLVDIDDGVHVRIAAPYAVEDSQGEPLVIPWTVYVGHVLALSTLHRDALVVLRDALSAALAAHPADEPAPAEASER
jgi:hypothetical protein